jgi:hypothetical protein
MDITRPYDMGDGEVGINLRTGWPNPRRDYSSKSPELTE